jgi:hypothetical protein
MIQKTKYFIFDINGSACKLNSLRKIIVLSHSQLFGNIIRPFLAHRLYMIVFNTYCLEEQRTFTFELIGNQFTQYNFADINNFFAVEKIAFEYSIVIYQHIPLLYAYRLFGKERPTIIIVWHLFL